MYEFYIGVTRMENGNNNDMLFDVMSSALKAGFLDSEVNKIASQQKAFENLSLDQKRKYLERLGYKAPFLDHGATTSYSGKPDISDGVHISTQAGLSKLRSQQEKLENPSSISSPSVVLSNNFSEEAQKAWRKIEYNNKKPRAHRDPMLSFLQPQHSKKSAKEVWEEIKYQDRRSMNYRER